jgi:exosortase
MHLEESSMEPTATIDATTVRPATTPSVMYWIGGAILAVLMLVLFAASLADLASEWWNYEESSYGMIVPPLALAVAYLQRRKTFSIPAQPSFAGLWVLGLGCITLLLGQLAGEFFLTRISFVIVLAGLVWTFWGGARLKTLAFPFVLLGTMVPLPGIIYQNLATPLQLLASRLATDLAQAMGVSMYRDGNIIHLANSTLGVAEACSGLHSLPALVVGAMLLGFLLEASIAARILLVVISVPLAIAVNVLRVTGTAVLADYKPEFAEGFYHSFSGWLVFVVGFGVLWLIAQGTLRLMGKSK